MATPRTGGRGARPTRRVTPMWLAHHFPEDYDRCVRIGDRHVCRRCLVLYPIAFVVMAATYGWHPPAAVDVALVAGLPLPAVVEFVLEHVGVWRHSPRRQVAVTVLLGLGLGRAFSVYLHDQTSLLFWGVVIGYTAVCGAAALVRQRRQAAGGAAAAATELD